MTSTRWLRWLTPALILLLVFALLQKLPIDPDSIPLDPTATGRALSIGLFLGALLTEDVACIAAGLLVAREAIDLLPAILLCFAGFLVGNILLYGVGAAFGLACLGRPPCSWVLTADQVEASVAWFRRRGPAAVFLTRFLPGTRVACYFTAGLLRVDFGHYLASLALSTAIWTTLLVAGSALLGAPVLAAFAAFERWALPTIVALALLVWVAFRVCQLRPSHENEGEGDTPKQGGPAGAQ